MPDTPKKKAAGEKKTATTIHRSELASHKLPSEVWIHEIQEGFNKEFWSGLLDCAVSPTVARLCVDLVTGERRAEKNDHWLRYKEFGKELNEIRRRAEEQARELLEERESGNDKQKKIQELEGTLDELKAKEQVGFLLGRVNPEAQRRLLVANDLRDQFLTIRECNAFVLSVDIRRSTELMLKARSPERFSSFITKLCSDMMEIITEQYGVFDKFTGDGVLAFFPDFYSGEDAAYHAITAADRCHASFRDHYTRCRSTFSSVLLDTGLGIGVDYGSVHLVQMAGGLTVVGSPVVYACRLSGAPAGVTLVNQPAYDVISSRYGAGCFITETTIEIKHEGAMLAYEVRLNSQPHQPSPPEWIKEDTKSCTVECSSTP